MTKAYTRITWENYPSEDTPLNETNLNKMDLGLDTVDDRVITLDTTKVNITDNANAIVGITFDSATGVFTFTKFNGATFTIDTLLEKIIVNFDYDDDPTSAHYQNLIITMEDGSVKYVDLSALITQYEFTDTSTIGWTITSGGNVTANVLDGSITEAKLQPNYLALIRVQAENAAASATNAGLSATAASNSATASSASADKSESWAVGGTGTRSGEDTNNSKYWAERAAAELSNTVRSFNGRNGVVVPANGDYSIGQISASGTQGQVPMLDSNGDLVMSNLPNGGHSIQNASGTTMATEPNLQFKGNVTVTDDPTNNRTVVEVSGGASGGHTIYDADEQAMPQRAGLGFTDAHVSDNSGDDRTDISIVEGISKTDWDNLDPTDPSNNGLYEINDPNNTPILDASMVAYLDGVVGTYLNKSLHLSGLRFKNLGTSFTADQATAIANGDFRDLWNGDYWVDEVQGFTWRIVDNTDFMLRRGDTEFTAHGLVVMADEPLIPADGDTRLMNDTASTATGYNGTKYRSTYRSQCRTKVANFFGDAHCGNHREFLSNASSGGRASGWTWADCDVEIPSEVNIYGHNVWSTYSSGGSGFNIGSEWGQFRLFQIAPYFAIDRNNNYWLRDIVSSEWFAFVGNYGDAEAVAAYVRNVGLRPYFILV